MFFRPALPGFCESVFPELRAKPIDSASYPDANLDELSSLVVRMSSVDDPFHFQYGLGIMSFHALKPYIGFEMFLSKVERLLTSLLQRYEDLVIESPALLYLNEFDFSLEPVVIVDYFRIDPHIPRVGKRVPKQIREFRVYTDVEYEELRRAVQLGLYSYPERQVGLQLECCSTLADEARWSADSVVEWLRTSHDILGDTFETVITDRTRDFMKRKDQE